MFSRHEVKAGNHHKAFWHLGETITFKDKARIGTISLNANAIVFEGTENLSISFSDIKKAEIKKMYAIGTVIQVTTGEGVIFFSIIRFSYKDWFLIINYFATKSLFKAICSCIEAKENFRSPA